MRVKPAAIILAENLKFLAPRLTKLAEEKRGRFGAVPTIRISFEAADQILRQRRRKCRIRVKVSRERGTSHNVWATLPGTEKPHEIVVIGGHYDSVWGGSGAQDNAGGVAVVMELARVFGIRGSKRTMKFCCFGSEELGLRGSTAYVRTLLAEDKRHQSNRQKEGWMLQKSALNQHRLMLNVDLQGLLMGENYCPVGGPVDLVAAVRLLAAEIGPAFKFDEECYSSDNAPFANVGVPTASFGRFGPELMWGHTEADTLDKCWGHSLKPIGKYLELFLARYVADAKQFPFPREIPEEHRKKVREYFIGRCFGFVDD
jgi:aminopeptidase YwaD